jgi:hypothetical protein
MITALLLALSTALASPWPELPPPPPLDPAPADTAVIVGIDRYFVVQDVPGATRNAEDWYRYLTTTRGVPPSRATLLRDGEATRERILAAVADAARRTGPGGRVWFVFVGHGVPTPDGKDGVLVGVDAQGEPDALYPRSVSRSELLRALGAAPGVMVLDACFSGQSTGGPLLPGLQFLVPSYAPPATPVAILSAGTATEFAGPLPGGGRPAFSYLVLGGLHGWADADADGRITASEAVTYAREALRATIRGRTQTPELAGPDLPLGRSAGARGPNLVEIVVARPAPPRAPPTLAADDPLVARLADLHRAQQARLAAERAEADARATLDAQIRQRLDDEERALIRRAEAGWRALEPLLAGGGPEAREGAAAFVAAWRDAAVVVGDQRRAVPIPYVDRATAFLQQGDPNDLVRKVTAPPPPPYDPIPWGLWAVETLEFRPIFEQDPARAWDLHQAVRHLPAQVGAACGDRCGDERAQAEALLADVATYAAARLDPAFARLSVRDLGFMFLGMREEARDLWYAAAGAERPLLLTADLDGFSATAPAEGRAWQARAALVELGVWLDRRGVEGKCPDKIDVARRDLVARYDAVAARLDGTDAAADAELGAVLRAGHALAGKALRCK